MTTPESGKNLHNADIFHGDDTALAARANRVETEYYKEVLREQDAREKIILAEAGLDPEAERDEIARSEKRAVEPDVANHPTSGVLDAVRNGLKEPSSPPNKAE
jgi:hypothetical protein